MKNKWSKFFQKYNYEQVNKIFIINLIFYKNIIYYNYISITNRIIIQLKLNALNSVFIFFTKKFNYIYLNTIDISVS